MTKHGKTVCEENVLVSVMLRGRIHMQERCLQLLQIYARSSDRLLAPKMYMIATNDLFIGTVCGMWLKAKLMRMPQPADRKARGTSDCFFSLDRVAVAASGGSSHSFALCCFTFSASHS